MLKLSDSEVNHLLNLIHNNEEEGFYYGNKEQYWKRSDRIKEKLNQNGNRKLYSSKN